MLFYVIEFAVFYAIVKLCVTLFTALLHFVASSSKKMGNAYTIKSIKLSITVVD